MRSGHFAADKITILAMLPNGKEDIELNGMKGTTSGAAAGRGRGLRDGEPIDRQLQFFACSRPKPKEGKPARALLTVTGKGGAATSNVKFDG